MKTDLASHHVEGHARAAMERGLPSHFSVDLISHIDGNLWMGGCIGGVALPEDFKHVVSLYPWEQFSLSPGTERVEVEMFDSAEMPDSSLLRAVVRQVVKALDDGKTLVHCQAGLNRSGLISALVLIELGRSPEDAIALLRERRCGLVLCNEAFERFLLGG